MKKKVPIFKKLKKIYVYGFYQWLHVEKIVTPNYLLKNVFIYFFVNNLLALFCEIQNTVDIFTRIIFFRLFTGRELLKFLSDQSFVGNVRVIILTTTTKEYILNTNSYKSWESRKECVHYVPNIFPFSRRLLTHD